MRKNNQKIYGKLLREINQSPKIRQKIIAAIEKNLNKTVITFFTSFKYPVMIEDKDAVMLEEVLQNTKINKNGFVLMINSPGGSGLAAERIINVCRACSNDKFEVLIPNMAKSAATMVCLGSNKIYMSKTAELGPIDPQIAYTQDNVTKRLSIHSIITSYEKLFDMAINSNGQRLEPYLQQLNRYDARDIEEFKRAMELSESIAVKSLKSGMMNKFSEEQIKTKIKPFLEPLKSKSHGRPIFIKDAQKCDLKVEAIDMGSTLWHDVWELYIRSDYCLNNSCAKLIESKTDHFNMGVKLLKGAVL